MFDDNLIERFELASERIKEIKTAGGACSDGRFSDYFCKMSEFIISMTELFGKVKNNEFEDYTFNQLSEFNKSLYEDILEKNYDKSYANPVYAVKVMGLEYGRMLSFLYVELRGMIAYAYELRIAEMTVLMELFVEIYCSFESETPDSTSLRDIIYWYVSDYSDDFVEYRVREQIDTSLSFATDIIMNENLEDLRLYAEKIEDYIIQPFISGREYTIDIFCDYEGNPVYITPRERLAVRAGEVLKTQIVQDDVMIHEMQILIEDYKPCGQITVQLIRDEVTGKDYYIEINPRFGGGAPLSMKAGADSASAILRMLRGDKLSYIERAAIDGAIYSRYDQSVRVK